MSKSTADRSENARDLILDAAKQYCAQHGWSRMTVRAIAAHANVNSALLGYYFENKEKLARELIRTTSQSIAACRRASFQQLHEAHGKVIPLEALVRAFAEPFLLRKHPLREDVRVYLSTTTHLVGNPADPLVRVARSINREMNSAFLSEIRLSLPDAETEPLHVRFEMMLGAMIFTSALLTGARGLAYFSPALLGDEALLTQFARDWATVFALPSHAASSQP